MMDRRCFLRNSALLAAGVVAADQLELVERLGWQRRFFPGADFSPKPYFDVNRYFRVTAIAQHGAGGYLVELQRQMRNGGWEILNVTLAPPGVNSIGIPALTPGGLVRVDFPHTTWVDPRDGTQIRYV